MNSSLPGKILSLKDAPDLAGKVVLLRLDLNLPIVEGKVGDQFRLQKSLPTLEFLKKVGARTVILSHTDSKETDSLFLVAECLKKFIDFDFVPSFEVLPECVNKLEPGKFLFLENLRRNPGEVANDPKFTKSLASMGDIYVNDAFAVSHRPHASIVGLPQHLPSFAGFLLEEEILNLSKAFHPPKPFVFILAGADKKLTSNALISQTKFPLIEKFLKSADLVFVGGALANSLLKAKDYEIGKSKHTEGEFSFKNILAHPRLLIPIDVVVENGGRREIKKSDNVSSDDTIVDAGPESIASFEESLANAKFVLWNGTLGICEHGFTEGTRSLAEAISRSGAESIIGGGDTVAALDKLNLIDGFSFVSTGGGAMLDFLANETLPGIEALKSAN